MSFRFEFFHNNEDFAKWQDENPKINIHQISPITYNASGGQDGNDFGLTLKVGVFVLYSFAD